MNTFFRAATFSLATTLIAACSSSVRYVRDDPPPDEQPSRSKALLPAKETVARKVVPPEVQTPRRAAHTTGSDNAIVGRASYYGRKFHGRKTASGERFDMHAMTAAHTRLPFGTRLRVTNLANHRSVIVRVNDRGPYKKSRILDVSRAAAERLGMIQSGTAKIRLEIIE
ncbi:MAG: septal ring lytic transglycosylase RlpA family protein [Chitinivibrionales bacterium]|nr:septal ring lytic transglycosylase RlpA family protein [Chitinivibrionales bacterium]